MTPMIIGNTSQWPEHWTKGGNGVTKLKPEQIAIANDAIKLSGMEDLWMDGDALYGYRMPRDLGAFWRMFRELEAATK